MSDAATTSAPAAAPAEVFLQPGQWCVATARQRVRTLLGSCVSVTLWSPHARLGAMSHFLLATRGRPAVAEVRGLELRALDGRYGDEALHLMLHELGRRGVAPAHCEAKIFGGGHMFPGQVAAHDTVGRRNGEAARVLLAGRGLRIASESLFGDGHRNIVFDVATGDVWSRQRAPVEGAAR